MYANTNVQITLFSSGNFKRFTPPHEQINMAEHRAVKISNKLFPFFKIASVPVILRTNFSNIMWFTFDSAIGIAPMRSFCCYQNIWKYLENKISDHNLFWQFIYNIYEFFQYNILYASLQKNFINVLVARNVLLRLEGRRTKETKDYWEWQGVDPGFRYL